MSWYDGGEVWAEVRQWILVMRRRREIQRNTAAKEWRLLNETLGSERTVEDLRRWFRETFSDEMKDMVRHIVRCQRIGAGLAMEQSARLLGKVAELEG
jgi:hypothetical protein